MSKQLIHDAEHMLDNISDDLQKHYYDPQLHGVNWDAKVRETREKIEKQTSMNMALANIAAALDSLDDSHTYFVPPPRPFTVDYGWRVQSVGERCFVTRVKPGTDAASKVKPGDEVLSIVGARPDRPNLWRIEYVLEALRPQKQIDVKLRDPDGKERQETLLTHVEQKQRIWDPSVGDIIMQLEGEAWHERIRYIEYGNDLAVYKIPAFTFDELVAGKLAANMRKHQGVILDLRGDPGGVVDTLKYFLGYFFDHDVKIGDEVARDKTRPMMAKSHGHGFDGKLVVLVDSNSASAAELFARVIQLEKRGAVIGDRTSGSVMESEAHEYRIGTELSTVFAASITRANILMTDGKSLEHVGVVPDETLLPTAADLAAGRDPVLAHAAETLGMKLSPEQAGRLFPYEWPEDK